MTFGVTHVYTGKLTLVVRMDFGRGVMSDVVEHANADDAPPSEFVLTGEQRELAATL